MHKFPRKGGRKADRRIVSSVAAFSGTVSLFFGGFDAGYGPPLIGLLGAATLLLMLMAAPPDRRFWRDVAPPMSLIAGAVTWAMIGSGAGSYVGAPSLTPDLMLSQLSGIGGATALLLVGTRLGYSSRTRTNTIRIVLAFALVALLISAFDFFFPDPAFGDLWPDGQDGRFAGTLGNANVAAACFAAISVLALEQALRPPARAAAGGFVWRGLAALCCALALAACIATESRMGIVACGTALLALIAITRSVHRRWTLLGLLPAVGLAAWLVVRDSVPLPFDRFESLSTDLEARREMWVHYFRLAAASPLFGYGLGSFPSLNLAELVDPRQAGGLWMVNSAHNLLLQLMIAGGVPYMIALGSAGWLVLARAWPGRALGLILAVAIIFACAMVDIVLDVPGVIALTMLLAGLAWGAGRRAIDQTNPLPLQQERHVGRT